MNPKLIGRAFALTLALATTPDAHASLLDEALIAYRAAPATVRAAIAHDQCFVSEETGGTGSTGMGARGNSAYNRVSAKLQAAYLADPRDGAVAQVNMDFCTAVLPK